MIKNFKQFLNESSKKSDDEAMKMIIDYFSDNGIELSDHNEIGLDYNDDKVIKRHVVSHPETYINVLPDGSFCVTSGNEKSLSMYSYTRNLKTTLKNAKECFFSYKDSKSYKEFSAVLDYMENIGYKILYNTKLYADGNVENKKGVIFKLSYLSFHDRAPEYVLVPKFILDIFIKSQRSISAFIPSYAPLDLGSLKERAKLWLNIEEKDLPVEE